MTKLLQIGWLQILDVNLPFPPNPKESLIDHSMPVFFTLSFIWMLQLKSKLIRLIIFVLICCFFAGVTGCFVFCLKKMAQGVVPPLLRGLLFFYYQKWYSTYLYCSTWIFRLLLPFHHLKTFRPFSPFLALDIKGAFLSVQFLHTNYFPFFRSFFFFFRPQRWLGIKIPVDHQFQPDWHQHQCQIPKCLNPHSDVQFYQQEVILSWWLNTLICYFCTFT